MIIYKINTTKEYHEANRAAKYYSKTLIKTTTSVYKDEPFIILWAFFAFGCFGFEDNNSVIRAINVGELGGDTIANITQKLTQLNDAYTPDRIRDLLIPFNEYSRKHIEHDVALDY